MAPFRPVLAQSESKARFFDRLGLDEKNDLHRMVYADMKVEAGKAYERLTQDREALVPELKNAAVKPPFSHGHISESSLQRETLRIYNNAHSKTRVIYDLAHYKDGNEGENWIFRCMLWHVFRYRDSRNKNRNGVDGGTGEVDNGTESGDNFRTHMAVESSSSQLNPRVGDLNDQRPVQTSAISIGIPSGTYDVGIC